MRPCTLQTPSSSADPEQERPPCAAGTSAAVLPGASRRCVGPCGLLGALASVGAAVAAAAASAPGVPERPPDRETRASSALLRSLLFSARPRLTVHGADAQVAGDRLVPLRIALLAAAVLFKKAGRAPGGRAPGADLAAVRGAIPNTSESCLRT